MIAYLDTSVLASLLVDDVHSDRARSWLRSASDRLAVSEWTFCELTSALGVAERGGQLSRVMRQSAEGSADAWIAQRGDPTPVAPEDIRRARQMMRATASPLRAGDALHIAILERTRCALASFDGAMRRAARDLGLPLEEL